MNQSEERIQAVLGQMGQLGPKNLRAYLAKPNPDFDNLNERGVDSLIDDILDSSTNSVVARDFSGMLRSWDNSKDGKWIDGTQRNTDERRRRIHKCLGSDPALEQRIDKLIPYFRIEEPLIIAKEHEEWYRPEIHTGYYWKNYLEYLGKRKGWPHQSLMSMDNATRAVVECLADPSSPKAYSSRGLVIGYVQSGKTANFTGVAARAADAGYKLIIILAGTWNILRHQTQRRIDKELLGKEMLVNDEHYSENKPNDWDDFLEHGFIPSERGHFHWDRITTTTGDFRGLRAAIEALEFQRHDLSKPLYDRSNLDRLGVKLLVIKKNPTILNKLNADLGRLRTKIKELPALIIDDESDQAGLNTIDPKLSQKENRRRTETNKCIVKLLGLLPRGQYVGYTATPYANVFVDPNDLEDLFPKDFIISLDRPDGYMGISDFFDPEIGYEELKEKNDYKDKEIAFIRRVNNAPDADDEDLKTALRAFLISGAIKLYRESKDPDTYSYRHHTMLVHTSGRKGEHVTLDGRIQQLWNSCAFSTPKGLSALEELFESDFKPVSESQAPKLPFPANFASLRPFLVKAMGKITTHQRLTMVLNSDNKDAPDFSEAPVWRIIVGGNKLSRGYTVEGLTVSYYRRVAGAADTLMQMGRWFGFRHGYMDLVRIFLGVNEGKKGSDLVALFKSVCLMEEKFREEVKRYISKGGRKRITPKDVPPLIQITGELKPTTKNKMFNAIIRSKNYGGRWSQPTLVAADGPGQKANVAAMTKLLIHSKFIEGDFVFSGKNSEGKNDRFTSNIFESGVSQVADFLEEFHWLKDDYEFPARPADIELQLEFLRNAKHEIKSFLVIIPQMVDASFGEVLDLKNGLPDLTVKKRTRVDGRRYHIMGESVHRRFAAWVCGIKPKGISACLSHADPKTTGLKNVSRGILLVYPVREHEKDTVDIGYEILFPNNGLGYDINFSVRRESDSDAIVVPVEKSS